MERISRDSIEMRAAIALQKRRVVKVKDWGDDGRLPSDQVIDHIVGIVLDEVFKSGALVIGPTPIPLNPPQGSGVTTIGGQKPGEWGVTEPWPDEGR